MGVIGCVQVCAGLLRYVRMCAGVFKCKWVQMGVHQYVWDEFSEYLLETRFLTSANYNTHLLRIFFLEFSYSLMIYDFDQIIEAFEVAFVKSKHSVDLSEI